LILHLNTQFNEEETRILHGFMRQVRGDISVVLAMNADQVNGVTNPNRMIRVGGLCLCEEKNEPGKWYMGQMSNGTYDFWGRYGNLHDALEGL